MNVFIVHAHPERKSFNAAVTARAIDTFVDHGDHVTVSDLYAMNFDPVSDRRNFRGTADGAFLSNALPSWIVKPSISAIAIASHPFR